MKKFSKLIAGILAAATLALSITGCGTKFDAKTYVQGRLDAAFKGEISDSYAKITEGGKDGIQKEYDDAIAELTAEYEMMGCPEELLEPFKAATVDMLKACKYTVGEGVKDDDGNYTVSVTIEPLSMKSEEMAANAPADMVTWTVEQQFEYLLAAVEDVSKNPVYGEAVTIDVRVNQTSDKRYEVLDSDAELFYNSVLIP